MENNKDIFKDSFEEEKQKNDTSHDFLNNINKSKGEGFKEEKFIYQKTSSTKWIIRFAFVLLIGAIAFFLLNQKSTVIDLTGMSGNDALSWGTENNIIVTLLGRYSSDMEEGRVISQSIDPGEKVEKNMNIILEVSEGLDPYGSVSLPEFDASWSKTSIDRWLKQNGIENYTVKYAENEEIEEGFLISYRLIGATKDNFLRSSEIEFVICMSEEEETVIVQDFLNKTLLEADIWAKRNNIEYIYSYEESSIYPEDRIMYQSIDADEEISPAETLILIISSGKSEIVMDDFINKTMAEVDAWAKKVDIAYEQIQLFSSIYPKGRIISQSIPAGDIVDPQSTLIVGISKGERAIVPDFSSVSSDDAVNYSDDLKITVKEIYFPGISNGDYISQSLAPDTEVAVGTDLTVCYSLGSEIYINDFKSKDITELESWIRDVNNMGAELALSVIYEEGTGYAKGKIIDQIPYSEKIPLSSSIEITVSLDSLIKVPDFFSSAEETAVSDNQQLDIQIIKMYAKGTKEGEFISQSPAPGTLVVSGSKATVIFSLGDRLMIGDFTKKPLQDIESWIDEQNSLGAGLELITYEQYSSSIAYGSIVSLDRINGSIPMGDTIKAIVSIGKSYTVNDFRSMSRQDILNYARIYELNIVFEEKEDSGLQSGEFISQYPAYGVTISKNDFITITYAK